MGSRSRKKKSKRTKKEVLSPPSVPDDDAGLEDAKRHHPRVELPAKRDPSRFRSLRHHEENEESVGELEEAPEDRKAIVDEVFKTLVARLETKGLLKDSEEAPEKKDPDLHRFKKSNALPPLDTRLPDLPTSETVWGTKDLDSDPKHAFHGGVVLTAGIGTLLIGILITALAFDYVNTEPSQAAASQSPEEPDLLAKNQAWVEARSDVIVERFLKFIEAEGAAEKLPYVRRQDRVKPLMETYYQSYPSRPDWYSGPEVVTSHYQLRARMLGDQEVYELTFYPPQSVPVNVFFTRSFGSIEFDWESYAGYGDLTLDRFIWDQPEEAVLLRAEMAFVEDREMPRHFPADEFYLVRLTDQQQISETFAYLPKDRLRFGEVIALANSVRDLNQAPSESHAELALRVTIQARFRRAQDAKRVPVIESLVRPNWVAP